MTIEELDRHYPRIRHAIAYVELIACTVATYENVTDVPWNVLMRTGASPDVIAKCLAEGMQEEAELSGGKFILAAQEAKLPEFLTYIAGKMGAV